MSIFVLRFLTTESAVKTVADVAARYSAPAAHQCCEHNNNKSVRHDKPPPPSGDRQTNEQTNRRTSPLRKLQSHRYAVGA